MDDFGVTMKKKGNWAKSRPRMRTARAVIQARDGRNLHQDQGQGQGGSTGWVYTCKRHGLGRWTRMLQLTGLRHVRQQSMDMDPSAEPQSAGISGGADEFVFRCAKCDLLVENTNGNANLATGNTDMKLRVPMDPGEADMRFIF